MGSKSPAQRSGRFSELGSAQLYSKLSGSCWTLAQAVLFTFVVLTLSLIKVKTKNKAVLMCGQALKYPIAIFFQKSVLPRWCPLSLCSKGAHQTRLDRSKHQVQVSYGRRGYRGQQASQTSPIQDRGWDSRERRWYWTR